MGRIAMKYYKDSNDKVYAYEDGDDKILDGLTQIDDKTALALVAPRTSNDDLVQDARARRNAMLRDADYSINKIEDTGGDASSWREYRQALRDWPASDGFPDISTIPTQP